MADMNILSLWFQGTFHPFEAFNALRNKPSPAWGFGLVAGFNLTISCTSLLALYLLGRGVQMESVLTFLPTEKYLPAEMFFLPILRTGLWLYSCALLHLGLRLAHLPSNFDLILNIGGLGYLVVMPPLLLSDWLLIATHQYQIAVTAFTHAGAAAWGFALAVIGLRKLLDAPVWLGVLLNIISTATSIALLSIFAR